MPPPPAQTGSMFEFVDCIDLDLRDELIDQIVATGRNRASVIRYLPLMEAQWTGGDNVTKRPGWAYREACQRTLEAHYFPIQFATQVPQNSEFRGNFPDSESAVQYVNDIGAPDYVFIIFGQYEYEVWVYGSQRDGSGLPPTLPGQPAAVVWGEAPDNYEP